MAVISQDLYIHVYALTCNMCDMAQGMLVVIHAYRHRTHDDECWNCGGKLQFVACEYDILGWHPG